MHLDDVRELKQRALQTIVKPLAQAGVRAAALAYAASETHPRRLAEPQRLLALGVARGPRGRGYKLAVRLQRHSLAGRAELERLTRMAAGEVDVRFVGRVAKRALPWHQRRLRPLQIGGSVGHHRITAGTLGAFVRAAGDADGALMMLSNNHVLANENRARRGDAILQPGDLDGGLKPGDTVATLERFVRLRRQGNRVDAAVATLADGIEARLRALRGLGGVLRGVAAPEALDEGLAVMKVGRTTGVTRGRVSAFELDDVVVAFDIGNIAFDDQIEIDSDGAVPFSDGGDSGSLIVDGDRRAVALLFAGSESGGANGLGVTYANPIASVLAALRVELALA